jgi:DNA-binding winged helix-turn-helix (wHTH) protein
LTGANVLWAVVGVIRFGAFELDLRSRELRRERTRIALPGQSVELLAALLERPGELVSRERLRERLWPAGTFVDFEHGLNAIVKRLRNALGDSATAPRFVETLPRRGYRFIAPVSGRDGDSRIGPAVEAPGLDGRGVLYRGAVGWGAAVLGLSLLGLYVLRPPDD